MTSINSVGWKKLIEGFPWFEREGRYPIPAYSEFMPPPRLGRSPYGEIDPSLFSEEDGREGFTLVEAMLAVFVLSIAAAGVLLPFVSGATVRAEGARRTLAAGLASDLMEQILRLPFHDLNGANYSLGPEPGETGPANFDNIDDYHGYIEAQGQVKDAAGAVFADPRYANFSRNVTCEYVYVPPQPVESDPAKCEFIRITVQVNYSGKPMATIVRLVSE